MTVAQRFLLTLAIVLAILLALAALGYFTGNWNEDESLRPGYGLASAESRPEPLCMDEQTREQVRAILLQALDDSLHDHIKSVFAVWLRDATGQPGRARTGVHLGIKAYLGARQNTLEWAPPACS